MKGFIYRIYDNTNGNVYYGSTLQKVSQRISEHRSNYKQYLKGKHRNGKSFGIIKIVIMIIVSLKKLNVKVNMNYITEKDFILKIINVLINVFQTEQIKNIIKAIKIKFGKNIKNIERTIKNRF